MTPKGKPTKGAPSKGVEKLDVILPEEGQTFKAEIVRIEMAKAGDVYGEKAKDPDKAVANLHFEADGIAGRATLSYTRVPNAKSNLFKFMKRYREAPHRGQTVDVAQDEDGFWRLVIE